MCFFKLSGQSYFAQNEPFFTLKTGIGCMNSFQN